MKMLPCVSQVTSVGWRNWPLTAGSGGLGCFQGFGSFVGRFLLAPEHHHHAAFGIELDDHVGAFVDGPEVIVLVEADGMREGPGVEIVADFANVLSVGPEFENLRSGGGIGRSGGVATREDEDVFLRVDGHSGCFAQIQVWWKLQEIGNGFVGDFGNLCPSEIVAKRDRDSEASQGKNQGTCQENLLGYRRATISNLRAFRTRMRKSPRP